MADSSSLLDAWSRTLEAAPGERTVSNATTRGSWTRGEIDGEATEWRDRYGGMAAGQVVALAEPNGAEWLRTFIGLLKCDAVIAPLEPGEPVEAQRETARRIGATLLCRSGDIEVLSPPRRKWSDGRRLIKLTSGSTGAPRSI